MAEVIKPFLSLRILEAEKSAWQKIKYESEKEMWGSPNEFCAKAISEADKYIADIERARNLILANCHL